MDVTVIGYGSLMSGRGLAMSGALQVRQARVVALSGCRRGYAKLSRYGDRLAMALEVTQPPLEGYVIESASPPNGAVETLALTIPGEDCCRLAQREGYSPDALRQLLALADAHALGLAEWLWTLHAEAGHDLVQYRRRLFALTGYTSAHYIPHPVRVRDAGYAVIFLAPGCEGTGADEVLSIRQQTGIENLMNADEAWHHKPNEDQLAYFLSCLLGGAHGICVRDLLPALAPDRTLAAALARRLREALAGEEERLLAILGLTAESYRQAFGESEAALARSGLRDFLNKNT